MQIRFGSVQLFESARAALVVQQAFFGQRLATRCALQKAYAEARFKPCNGLADGRARKPQSLGCGRESTGLHDLYEGGYAIEWIRCAHGDWFLVISAIGIEMRQLVNFIPID